MTWGALRGTGITWDAFHGRIKHSSVLASHKLLATVLRSRRVFFFVFRYANPCHLGYGLHSRCGHGRGIRECVCTRRDVLLVPTDRGGSLDSIASLYCHSCAPTRVDPADGIRTTLTTERLGATRTAALVVRGERRRSLSPLCRCPFLWNEQGPLWWHLQSDLSPLPFKWFLQRSFMSVIVFPRGEALPLPRPASPFPFLDEVEMDLWCFPPFDTPLSGSPLPLTYSGWVYIHAPASL